MKRFAIGTALVLVLIIASAQVFADTAMRIGAVGGLISADTAKAGDTIKVTIEWVNRNSFSYNPSVGFRIYNRSSFSSGAPGSGSATWTSVAPVNTPPYYTLSAARARSGPQVDTSGGFRKSEFGAVYVFNCFNCDGTGIDTIGFAAAANDPAQTAIPPNDSGVAFKFILVTHLADTGQVICIDSSANFPPSNTWKWASFNNPLGTPNETPTWSGAKCWVLENPSPADVNEVNDGTLPTKFELAQNYPNPFNPSTIIRFDLPKKSNVKLNIYNVLGQHVKTLFDGERAAGKYEAEWNGMSESGVKVSSGTYFYKIEADNFVKTKKMLLLK